MGRLTVRLPGTLHEQLRALADREGVSLNQYIVYALTQQVTLAYRVRAVTEEEVREQRERYSALLEQLGEAAFPEIKEALAGRETVDGEEGLSPEVVERLKNRTVGPMG